VGKLVTQVLNIRENLTAALKISCPETVLQTTSLLQRKESVYIIFQCCHFYETENLLERCEESGFYVVGPLYHCMK
jgi:hypothetical protein